MEYGIVPTTHIHKYLPVRVEEGTVVRVGLYTQLEKSPRLLVRNFQTITVIIILRFSSIDAASNSIDFTRLLGESMARGGGEGEVHGVMRIGETEERMYSRYSRP